jgi:hypothetical protein
MQRTMSRVGFAGLVVGLGLSLAAVPAAAQSIPVVVTAPSIPVAMPGITTVVTPALPGLVVGVPGIPGGKATIERERSRTKEKATITIAE